MKTVHYGYDASGNLTLKDDYEGYDNMAVSELDKDMAEEVAAFVNQLIERNLRFVENKKHSTRGVLEWLVDGPRQQAIPFVVPAA